MKSILHENSFGILYKDTLYVRCVNKEFKFNSIVNKFTYKRKDYKYNFLLLGLMVINSFVGYSLALNELIILGFSFILILISVFLKVSKYHLRIVFSNRKLLTLKLSRNEFDSAIELFSCLELYRRNNYVPDELVKSA